MTITQYKKQMEDFPKEGLEKCLKNTLEKIKFLESIYMTGGKNYYYSEYFRDTAHRERQELCQLSSACYSLLREQ